MTLCLLFCTPRPSEKGSALKERFAESGSDLFHLRVDLCLERAKFLFTTASPGIVPILHKVNTHTSKGIFSRISKEGSTSTSIVLYVRSNAFEKNHILENYIWTGDKSFASIIDMLYVNGDYLA